MLLSGGQDLNLRTFRSQTGRSTKLSYRPSLGYSLLLSFSPFPVQLGCGLNAVAIRTPDLALGDFFEDPCPGESAVQHYAHFATFFSANVIELEDDRVCVATICTTSTLEELAHETLIPRDVPQLVDVTPGVVFQLVTSIVSLAVGPLTRKTIGVWAPTSLPAFCELANAFYDRTLQAPLPLEPSGRIEQRLLHLHELKFWATSFRFREYELGANVVGCAHW